MPQPAAPAAQSMTETPLQRTAPPGRPAALPRLAMSTTTGTFILLLMAALYVGKALFLPLIAAVLLSFLFAPVVRWLADHGLPRVIGTVLVLGIAASAIGSGIYALSTPAGEWTERLPAALDKVKYRLRGLGHPVHRVQAAANQVESLTGTGSQGRATVTVAQPSSLASHVMSRTGEFFSYVFIAVIALFFLLASGGTILDRLVALIPALRSDSDPAKMLMGTQPELDSTMVLRESERLVGMFLRTTIVINAALAAVLSAAFWAVGLPNPLLWGVLAGALNFMPYVGPLIGIPIVALASIATFDSLAAALVPPLIYAAIACVEGNMISPFVLGRALAMSPVAIFVWMALWGWMWGAAGALIAVPMLVMVKEFCSRIEPLRGIARVIEP
jgi:predicted PurR-regulated permease PerM